jgi:ribonuclease Z
MLLKVTFLGTSGTVPSPNRNPSAILIQFEGTRLLFDCGEGTQRQMMIAKTGFKIDSVFITHLHTDHFIGIFGLIETMSLNERTERLRVFVPKEEVEFVKTLFKMFGYYNLNYPIEVHGLKDGDEINFGKFKILAFKTDHIVPSLGYALIERDRPGKFDRAKAEALGIPPGPLYSKLVRGEAVEINGKVITPDMVVGPKRKGRKIVYTGDTRPTDRIVEIAKDADLLIHDSSFTSDLMDWAIQTKHSTAREAAEVAKKANVRQLVLTHISARYSKDVSPLLKEAKDVFENVVVAEDFMTIDVRYRD